jgi:hypothetical protein
MKNVVFWTGIKNMKPNMVEKYGGYEWMDISKKSWEYWCEKNDCIFYEYNTPSQDDLKEFRVTWQRWFDVYDELEKNNIDYDKIFLVDACSIVKWNCPNFFELTDDRMTAWLDKDNWGWIYQSVVGYKEFFKQFNHDLSDKYLVNNYINAGAVIINKNHKEFFKSLKEFYYEHKDKLISLQDKEVIKGTDQTPFNYWLQINNIEVNTSLPFMYNLTHMHRKSMLMYNWQLEEDKTPYFIKYGYVWKYNGIPKNERTSLMRQTWDIVKDFYVDDVGFTIDDMLDNMPDKKDDNNTTSKKLKKDLYNFITSNELDYENKTILELGTSHGYTTGILASLFKEVITFDKSKGNIEKAQQNNEQFGNITFYEGDVYMDNWPDVYFDVVFVDCMHWGPMVVHDIITILRLTKGREITVIFDDYGLGWGPNAKDVKRVVDWFVENDYMKVLKKIGHEKGTQIQDSKDNILCDSEGIICKTLDKSTDTLGQVKLEWTTRNGEKTLAIHKSKEIDDIGLGDIIAESEGIINEE